MQCQRNGCEEEIEEGSCSVGTNIEVCSIECADEMWENYQAVLKDQLPLDLGEGGDTSR